MSDQPPTGPSDGGADAPPWQQPPGPAAGPQPPGWQPPVRPAPGGQPGWYSGPLPPRGLVRAESIPHAAGRAVVMTFAALATLGIGVLALVVLLAVAVAGVDDPGTDPQPRSFVAGDEGNQNTLLAIPVTGLILGESGSGGSWLDSLSGVTYGYDVKAALEEAATRPDIKGIVLEMDTPGGSVVGSRAIADAVAVYRERTGRPVLAFVRGAALSGGMYGMAGSDLIVADHGTLVGSIGVIFGPLVRYRNVVAVDGGLLGGGVETTGGITVEYVTAGRSKDIGNPYRDPTDEERRTLQQGVDNVYDEFVGHVAAGRSLEPATIRDRLGALLFDERTAAGNGLVDEVGNRDHAYRRAAELAGLDPGNWQVSRLSPHRSGLLSLLVRTVAPPATGAPADAATIVCHSGPTMLAYQGSLPSTCP